MTQYIKDTEYAVKKLFDLIEHENKELNNAINIKNELSIYGKDLFENNKEHLNAEILIELYGINSTNELKQKEIERITFQISINEFSIRVLGSTILQIAKQGISIIHQQLRNCPGGRLLGTQELNNIIWQARNQCMHFEDGNFNRSVVECFNKLERDFGNTFCVQNYNSKCMSIEVLDILNWKSFQDYERDMLLLQ